MTAGKTLLLIIPEENRTVPFSTRLHIIRPEIARVGLAAKVVDVAQDPLTIGLLCAIRIVVVSQDLSHLVH